VIPGGSEGIGLAVSEALVAAGADVFICSRSTLKLAAASARLENIRVRPDQRIAAGTLDVTNYESTRTALESLTAKFGAPDFLINCAGIAHPGYLDDLEIGRLKEMMDLNYFGTLHTVKALLPSMRRAGRGHIVNVSSMAGYLGLFGYTGYCASKYAVIGFSWALRQEIRPYGLWVSVLCPANTYTPGLERENRTKPKDVLALEEKVKPASAESVARALLRSLPRGPFLIHPTLETRLIYWATRWAPTRLGDRLLRRNPKNAA